MVMPLIPFEKTPLSFAKTLADGAGTEGGRRPTVVPAPSAASPELGDRPRRRTFTAAEKLRILRLVDGAGRDRRHPAARGALFLAVDRLASATRGRRLPGVEGRQAWSQERRAQPAG